MGTKITIQFANMKLVFLLGGSWSLCPGQEENVTLQPRERASNRNFLLKNGLADFPVIDSTNNKMIVRTFVITYINMFL